MWPWTKKAKTRKTIERRMKRLALESLEYRQVLSAGPISAAPVIKPMPGPAPLVAHTIPADTQRAQPASEIRAAGSRGISNRRRGDQQN